VDGRYADLPALSFAGAGEDPETAFTSCVGEGVERLSQVERPSDICCTASSSEMHARLLPGLLPLLADARAEVGFDEHAALDWVEGRTLLTAEPVLVPADWCLRRPKGVSKLKPRSAPSTGAAAGPTLELAMERALLELVERDAVGLWWSGGRRGRPLQMEASAYQEGVALVRSMRQERTDRASWLLDLTTELAVPTVAAVSFDGSGHGFACGFAARVDLGEAIRAAVFEMMLMELGFLLAKAKRESQGEGALNEGDWMHLRRSTLIDSGTCDLVHPTGRPSVGHVPSSGSPFSQLKAAFAQCGSDVGMVDLTRDEFGISVVFALSPALQPMPSSLATPRLLSVLAATGHDARMTSDVALL
jgi:ribosomal protein S12 methylthiotransferase accessory factor